MDIEMMKTLFEGKLPEKKEQKERKPIPAGKYLATLSDAAIDKTSVPWKVTFELTIIDGEFSNRKLWINNKIDEMGTKFLHENLLSLGAEPPFHFDNLTEAVTSKIGQDVEVYTKPRDHNGKTYQTTYINRVLLKVESDRLVEKQVGSSNGTAPTLKTDEELPF